MSYLVGTPKSKINKHEKKWLDLPWQKVRDSVEVKLFEHEGELYVLAQERRPAAKEIAMRRKRLARLLRKLRAMRRSLPVARSVAAADRRRQERSGPGVRLCADSDCRRAGQPVTRESFRFRVDKSQAQRGASSAMGITCFAPI